MNGRGITRRMADVRLKLGEATVTFLDKATAPARTEGNNAAWTCKCGMLLLGRCYFQFGHDCHTICPGCARRFRVKGDEKKRAVAVREE